jgi:hypothetical protein
MHTQIALTRRDMLLQSSCGFGYLAFASLAAAQAARQEPLARQTVHFPARARRVIFLFMSGGPSQVDTFDYKAELQRRDGEAIPDSVSRSLRRLRGGDALLASPWRFNQHGESGLWISELFPHLARHADKLCVLRGMHCDSPAHIAAIRQMHTGATTFVRPSLGAWVLYGLGAENESLPGFVTVGQLGRGGEPHNRGSAFLPAAYQGTPIGNGVIAHLGNSNLPRAAQQEQLRALRALNDDLQRRTGPDRQLEGVIESFELAFRMQSVAPAVLDLSGETPQTLAMYGVGRPETDEFARNCILARRLAEAGVRFIEVGGSGKWDQHARLRTELAESARRTDQPIAALLADLEQRGLLDDTLVIWGGEFGRLPANGSRDGRDHNNHGYTVWLAGGGAKGGIAHGRTDDFGFAAIEGRVHLHDLHATILHLLGLDHTRLTFRYSGRDFRLTDVHGNVVREILA